MNMLTLLRRRNRFFTLIELLLVMAVMAILMSMGAGAIFVISEGPQIRQGAVALGGKCAVARAKAASTYTYVAALLPTAAQRDIPYEFQSRSVGLCKVTVDNTTTTKTYTFEEFLEGQDWAMLPDGAVILGTVPNIDNETREPKFVDDKTLGISMVTIPGNAISNRKLQFLNGQDIPALIFSPDGQPESLDLAGAILFVSEGTVDGEGTAAKFLGNALNNRRVRINPFTGRADYEY